MRSFDHSCEKNAHASHRQFLECIEADKPEITIQNHQQSIDQRRAAAYNKYCVDMKIALNQGLVPLGHGRALGSEGL